MSYSHRVLVVDDEREMCKLMEGVLGNEGYEVTSATGGQQAIRLFTAEPFPVVVLDIVMTDIDGVAVLREIREQRPETKVIMLTAHANLDTAIEALHLGAFDYLRKGPQVWSEIPLRVQKAFEALRLYRDNLELRRELDRSQGFVGMVGHSPVMQKLSQLIAQVAVTDTTVLVRGETGTGKELVARAMHTHSTRQKRPFVVVDCNIPEALAESELFGVTKNYPGLQRKEPLTGLFELADGGTLFLDEIGDLPLAVQPKLLRALQEREIRPLGAQHPIRIDVRIIAATNRNLEQAMQSGHFRTDLYHRLNVITIGTPPLRERRDDIPELVQHFLAKMCEKLKRPLLHIADSALHILCAYDYPGNVRELENLLERAVILTSGKEILPDALSLDAKQPLSQDLMQKLSQIKLSEAHQLMEKMYLELQLQHTQGNISQAALHAGIDRKNFKQKLKKHNIAWCSV